MVAHSSWTGDCDIYVLFLLPDTVSVTVSDSVSKPDGYIVLYRNCSYCLDSDSNSDLDPDPWYLFFELISIPGSGFESVSRNLNKTLHQRTFLEKNTRSGIVYSDQNGITNGDFYIGSKRSKSDYLSVSWLNELLTLGVVSVCGVGVFRVTYLTQWTLHSGRCRCKWRWCVRQMTPGDWRSPVLWKFDQRSLRSSKGNDPVTLFCKHNLLPLSVWKLHSQLQQWAQNPFLWQISANAI